MSDDLLNAMMEGKPMDEKYSMAVKELQGVRYSIGRALEITGDINEETYMGTDIKINGRDLSDLVIELESALEQEYNHIAVTLKAMGEEIEG